MTDGRTSLLVAAALGALAVGCGALAGPGGTVPAEVSGPGPTTTTGPPAPPPAEVLDATVVLFDADGVDRHRDRPPPGFISDRQGLAEFEQRFVDGDPALGPAAETALAAGKVLVGATVSTGCSPADGAQLAFTASDVRVLPIGLPPDDPEVECVRAVTSVALLAVEPTDLPAGLPVRGT
jgi:hypothetical protein